MSYQEQLKDKRWLRRREEIFKKKGSFCSKCGSKHNLNIHHLRYIYGHMAWEYKDKDLIVLCSDCHEKVHGIDLEKEFKEITKY